jgi:hypothetical protein
VCYETPQEAMVDEPDEIKPPSNVADDVDESEMTSVMGPEERRVLLNAARVASETAPSETVHEEADFARVTARPPSTGAEQPVVVPGPPRAPKVEVPRDLGDPEGDATASASDLPAHVAGVADDPARTLSRAWPIVAFVLLAAAALYGAQR